MIITPWYNLITERKRFFKLKGVFKLITVFSTYYFTNEGRSELKYEFSAKDGGGYSITVTQKDHSGNIESVTVDNACLDKMGAYFVARMLARNTVTPTTVQDVIDDFNYLLEDESDVIYLDPAV